MKHDARNAGFSLIELLIVMSILATLAGVVTPVALRAVVSQSRAATADELENLAEAISEYFRDTGALPSALDDLAVDPSVTGWSGPYVLSSTPASGLSDVESDAWNRAYRLTPSGSSVLLIESMGEDGAFGTSTDISRSVDVTPIRRATTLRQLSILNQAITSYNAIYVATDPLSTDLVTLLNRLVTTGYLPSTAGFTADGWGDAFVPVPASSSPVVQLGSTNMGA